MSKKKSKIPDAFEFEHMIERYLSKQMTEKEQYSFLLLINDHKELKEEFELEKGFYIYREMNNNPAEFKDDFDVLKAIRMIEEDYLSDSVKSDVDTPPPFGKWCNNHASHKSDFNSSD